jgi:hypothetical protein
MKREFLEGRSFVSVQPLMIGLETDRSGSVHRSVRRTLQILTTGRLPGSISKSRVFADE